ncbi:MAG: hypothetical protein GY801_13970, partial [bacterium]|nr:hypothetical protein [bacterium]
FTWLAFLFVIACEWGFISWFQPPFLITVGSSAAGIVLLALWPLLFFKSGAFRQRYTQLPRELEQKELSKLLDSCAESFRTPARECLALLESTNREFQSQSFQSELDRIFYNLSDLSRNHALLYARRHQFGTAEQKRTMQSILQQQERSVENSLAALRSFSGNLTLLDAHPEDHAKMGSNLKAINQELQNVIQEV